MADLSADVNIFSSAPTGMVVTMNAFVEPSNQAAYLEAVRPIMKAMRENPENLFVVVSVNPTDAGHIRIVHGWKKDSKWFGEVCEKNSIERLGIF
jgi:hypothetical protein